MNIEKYLDKMRKIQTGFLEFIDDDENEDQKFQNLILILEDNKIRNNKNDLRLFLRHISSICANHHRGQNFFGKIERLLQFFKEDIKKYYLNSEIFNIFRKNKRILLFLIEANMIIFDKYVVKRIIKEKYVNKKYPHYFAPEIKAFMDEKWFPKYDPKENIYTNKWVEEIKKELPDNFDELRKIGENERYICQLIRDDNAREFIAYVNQSNFPLNSRIKLSIYETNSFLIKTQAYLRSEGIALIEYASFFGSIQIIKYMQMQGVELIPSMWLYAVHSRNAEFIHLLEDCHIEPVFYKDEGDKEKSYNICFGESIKCNHNAFAYYFLNNHVESDDPILNDIFTHSLICYNFEFMQNGQEGDDLFFMSCTYDYYLFAYDLLTNNNTNINRTIIQNYIF